MSRKVLSKAMKDGTGCLIQRTYSEVETTVLELIELTEGRKLGVRDLVGSRYISRPVDKDNLGRPRIYRGKFHLPHVRTPGVFHFALRERFRTIWRGYESDLVDSVVTLQPDSWENVVKTSVIITLVNTDFKKVGPEYVRYFETNGHTYGNEVAFRELPITLEDAQDQKLWGTQPPLALFGRFE